MNILDAIKLANDAAAKLRDAELNAALAAVKMEAVDLAEQVVRLRQENLDLKEAAKLREAMEWHDDVWRQRGTDGLETACCPKCWGGEQKVSPLADGGRYQWSCPVCQYRAWKIGGRDQQRADEAEAERRPTGERW